MLFRSGYRIGLISEDRKNLGLLMNLPLRENTSMVFLKRYFNGLFIDKTQEEVEIKRILSDLGVKFSGISQQVKELSGGNQQKVAVGKWLLEDLDILIFDEPTRGVDVGSKVDIYRLMRQLAQEGKSILMVSSESDEIINLSDRTLVMSQGRIVSEYPKGEISSEKILRDSAKYIK